MTDVPESCATEPATISLSFETGIGSGHAIVLQYLQCNVVGRSHQDSSGTPARRISHRPRDVNPGARSEAAQERFDTTADLSYSSASPRSGRCTLMTQRKPTPTPEPTTSLRVERRAYVRVASDLSATCRPSTRQTVSWPGTVHDISQGGLGLILRHRFRPGMRLSVELRESTGALVR